MDVESRSDSTNQSYATPGTLGATDAPNGYRVAILWRGDRETRRAATPHNNRYCRIFEELIALGIDAQPAVYADDYARRGARPASGLRRRAGLGRSDPRRPHAGGARPDAAGCRGARTLGQRASRRHPQNGRERSPAPHQASRLGHGHASLSHRRRLPCRVPATSAVGGPACHQAEPRQWRPGCVEGRSGSGPARRSEHCERAACAPRQRAGNIAAHRIPGALRALFRRRRLHHRSAVSGAAAGRHDPLLHGRRQGRRLRTSADQGADPAAAGRSGLARRAAWPAHHAWRRGACLSRRCGPRWKTSGRRR